MHTIGRLLSMGILALLLAGCLKQEVQIKLNADGSGTLVMTRYLSDMESGTMLLGETNTPSFKSLTVTHHEVRGSSDKPPSQIETSEFAFTNLAAALPELENLVPMMPRFSIQGDRLTVTVRHEMNEYHGFSSESDTNNFYHLEIEFPTPPESDTGRIEGNRVSWAANQDQLKAFKNSDIGTLLFACSVPASVVQLDLQPRLVTYDTQVKLQKKKKEPKLVSELKVTIPITSKNNRWTREGSNGTLGLYLPVDSSQLPLCYEDLKVKQLVINGQEMAPELQSETAGVYSGIGPRGEEAPGIPIKLQFGWNSPLLSRIDRVEASMRAAVPTATSLHTLDVDDATATNAVLNLSDTADERIAVIGIDHVFWQAAKLKVATNLNPTDLSTVYLDTHYGLRYPAKGINWIRGNKISSTDQMRGERIFGKNTPFSVVEILYPHIPTTSFQLTFCRVDEVAMKELVLTEENINVY